MINLLLIFNCKAQITTTDYINFYNDLASKLNSISLNKSQYYSQNFSNFYNELQNKNINIVLLNYDTKMATASEYYVLKLYFTNMPMWSLANKNDYQLPCISITFENEIPKQIEQIAQQANMKWNNTLSQFFADKKIQSIRFIGLNGYDSSDNSLK